MKKLFDPIFRSLALSVKKIIVLFGGIPMIPAALILTAAAFFICSLALSAVKPDSVSIVCVDECCSDNSAAFLDSLASADGVSLSFSSDRDSAEKKLLGGHTEAMLVILPGYDESLYSESTDASEVFIIRTAPKSVSSEAIRELIAGKLLSMRVYVRTVSELEKEGIPDAEVRLNEQLKLYDASAPTLYTVESIGQSGADASSALFGRGFAGYPGFTALVIMLLLLSLSRSMTKPEARLASKRLYSADKGMLIGTVSDFLSLFLSALAVGIIACCFASALTFSFCIALIAYCLCVSGLCMLFSRFGGSGRIDIAAPVIALVLSLLGGCFMDFTSLSPFLTVLSRCTPQGQFIAAANGGYRFLLLLLTEAALFVFLSLIGLRKHGNNKVK